MVPWELQGAYWEPGEAVEPADVIQGLENCAHCDAALDDVRVVLVRHRGEHRIPDAFCSVGHAAEWAKGGGRWR